MQRALLSAALLSSFSAFAADAKAVDGGLVWKAFDGGTYSASFPGEVTSAEHTDETQSGPVKSLSYTCTLPHEVFHLSIAEYPVELLKKAVPAQMLEGARDGAVANMAGVLEKDVAVFVDSGEAKKKWPGREFTFHMDRSDGDGGVTRAWMDVHMFMVDNKLYSSLLSRDATVKDDADFVKFVDGLKLKRPAKTPAAAPAKAPKGK